MNTAGLSERVAIYAAALDSEKSGVVLSGVPAGRGWLSETNVKAKKLKTTCFCCVALERSVGVWLQHGGFQAGRFNRKSRLANESIEPEGMVGGDMNS